MCLVVFDGDVLLPWVGIGVVVVSVVVVIVDMDGRCSCVVCPEILVALVTLRHMLSIVTFSLLSS